MKKKFSLLLKITASLAILLIAVDILLRVFFGLGSPPLFIADKDIGDLYKVDQNLRRFGSRIIYNQYHQRSNKLLDEPAYRILMLGDSIMNGGSFTDQKDTIPEILERKLNQHFGIKGEALNASADSWGIENEYEYLKKFGVFNSDIVIIQISTDDFVYPKSELLESGSIKHPLHNPATAIYELFDRYISPRIFKERYKDTRPAIPEDIKSHYYRCLSMVEDMIDIIKKENSQYIILFMPNEGELKKSYESPVVKLLNKKNIPFIDLADKESGMREEYFKDGIHLNQPGNQHIVDILFQYIVTNRLITENKG